MRSKVLFGLIALLTFTVSSFSAVLNVPSGEYPTIQSAIDVAVDGDIVALLPGAYTGEGNFNISFKGKAISVRSADDNPENCIIDCQQQGRGFIFEKGEGSGSVLQGVTIINGIAADFGGGIQCFKASPKIINCIIRNSHAVNSGGGIDAYIGAPQIINCIISDNTVVGKSPISGRGGGISLYKADAVITNCLMTGNSATYYGGAINIEGSEALITNCTIVDNISDYVGGVAVDAMSPMSIVVSSILWNNVIDTSSGLQTKYCCIGDGTPGEGNFSEDPKFREGPNGNYYLSNTSAGQIANSPCIDSGDPIADLTLLGLDVMTTRTDLGVDEGVVDIGYHYSSEGIVEMFDLTTSVIPDGLGNPNGILTPEGVNSFAKYAEVELFATPDFGYEVINWNGTDDDTLTSQNNVVTILEDASVSVMFQEIQKVELTLLVIDEDGDPVEGIGTLESLTGDKVGDNTWSIPLGQLASLQATPLSSEFRVGIWTGTINDASREESNAVLMDGNKTVTVEFVSATDVFLDVVVLGGHGYVDPPYFRGQITFDPDTGEPIYPVVSLEAFPEEGYEVLRWAGTDMDFLIDPFPTPNTEILNSVTLDYDKTVIVEFVALDMDWFRLDVVHSMDGVDHGTLTAYIDEQLDDDPNTLELVEIAHADALVRVERGELVYLQAVADPNYEVYEWISKNPPLNPIPINPDPFHPNDPNFMTVEIGPGFTQIAVRFELSRLLPNGTITLNDNPYITFPNIQAAIDAAADGDEVVVYPGYYTGPGNINLDYNAASLGEPKNITVRSKFGPEVTIINAAGQRGFYFHYSESDQSVVRGFTITNGNADRGGGIYCQGDSWPRIEDCIITNCFAIEYGGGICFDGGEEADELDEDPAGDPNDGGGGGGPGTGEDEDNPPPWVVGCRIENCVSTTYGGGIYSQDAEPRIISSEFFNNRSGQNPFDSDEDGHGSAIYSAGADDLVLRVINCLFTGNIAGNVEPTYGSPWDAGTIYFDGTSGQVRLCTLYQNDATAIMNNNPYLNDDNPPDRIRNYVASGIVSTAEDQVVADHTIVFSTYSGSFLTHDAFVNVYATNCCLDDKDAAHFGNGNIYPNSPMFIDGPLGSFYLIQHVPYVDEASMCVDAGGFILGGLDAWGLDPTALTTSIADMPDVDPTDIGYHYPLYKGKQPPILHEVTLDCGDNGYLDYEVYDAVTNNMIKSGTVYPGDPNLLILEPTVYIELEGVPDPAWRISEWTGTDDAAATLRNRTTLGLSPFYFDPYRSMQYTISVAFEPDGEFVLIVPQVYPTIEDAIEVAKDGDIIVVDKGRHLISDPEGINFGGRVIRLMSIDPDDPEVIAATIIDCEGTKQVPKRAFHFDNGETDDCLIAGFTIRRGWWNTGVPTNYLPGYYWPSDLNLNNTDPPVTSTFSGSSTPQDSHGYGGAVLCEEGSSPTFRYCVFFDNTVTGGQGMDAYQPTDMGGPYGYNIIAGHAQPGGNGGNGYGNGYGGAIACLDGSNPLIQYCTFRKNVALGGIGGEGANAGPASGGHEAPGGDGGMGYGSGYGGAIYYDMFSIPVITDCDFIENEVSDGRGGVAGLMTPGTPWSADWDAAAATVDGSGYSPDTIAGGAIFMDADCTLRLERCNFYNNRAYEWNEVYTFWLSSNEIEGLDEYYISRGGAVYTYTNCNVAIEDCDFMGNLGGAVFFDDGSSIQINDTKFNENGSAETITLAEYYSNLYGTLYVTDRDNYYSTFYGGPGGAISLGSDSPYANVTDCEFGGNFTYASGGAVATDSDISFIRCQFGGNTADNNGGAIFSDTRESVSGWYGGYYPGIYPPDYYYDLDIEIPPIDEEDETEVTGAKLNFDECHFTSNEAKYGDGGVVFLYQSGAEFVDTDMIANIAENGGAIYGILADITFRDGWICSNQAGVEDSLGGAIACNSSSMLIEDSILKENLALGREAIGGAISFFGQDVRYALDLNNCLFQANRSGNKGGAIICRANIDVNIRNSTFVDNIADMEGGGIFIDWSSNPVVVNSIFAGNNNFAILDEGGWDPIGGDTELEISHSLFHNNTDGDLFDGMSGLTIFGADTINSIGLNHDNMDGDPEFVEGPLGVNYLSDTSVAKDAGNATAEDAGLNDRTTSPDNELDDEMVDLGYHYADVGTVPTYTLTASVAGNVGGNIRPVTETYYKGEVAVLVAEPSGAYQVAKWEGGTLNDYTRSKVNYVVMNSDMDITVRFKLPRNLVVGSSPDYPDIQSAISAAEDGDNILVPPGHYYVTDEIGPGVGGAYFQYISFLGKTISLRGFNPDDPGSVGDTVLHGYRFIIVDVGPESVIEGLTFDRTQMSLTRSDLTIRNCTFFNGNWDIVDGDDGDGSDGFDGGDGMGGAINMRFSSPRIINVRFEDLSITGGDGGIGDNAPDGYDGGWAGRAYGGAIYIGYDSEPYFKGCQFVDCFAQGGNGGNGGNATAIGGYGGRGGNWLWDRSIEIPMFQDWWDGWHPEWLRPVIVTDDSVSLSTTSNLSSRFGPWGVSSVISSNYDWEKFSKWFSIEDYYSWDDWLSEYEYDPYEEAYDDYWRYSGLGGAVYCEFDSNPTFVDCLFEDCHSYGGLSGVGGQSNQILDPYPSRALNIPTSGGALFATRGCSVIMKGCVLRNNTADPTSNPDDQTIIEETEPTHYYVSYGGGVAATTESNLYMNDCTFDQNQATLGGGTYWHESYAEVTDCNFLGNNAYHGAGLFSSLSSGLIDRSYLEGNLANLSASDDLVIGPGTDPNGIVIPGQSAPTPGSVLADLPQDILYGAGGGFFCLESLVDVSNTVFNLNQASASGGGVFYMGSDPDIFKRPRLFNSLLTENSSGRDGAGVAAYWFARPVISNCTIAENLVTGSLSTLSDDQNFGGGLYAGYGSDVKVVDTIIWDNTAVSGSQVAVTGSGGGKLSLLPSRIDLTYSNVMDYKDVLAEAEPDPDADAIREGFDSHFLPANDDASSPLVPMGFEIDYFGTLYDSLYVNNNGNVTFDGPLATFTPFGLTTSLGTSIIAPFFADVDTSAAGSEVVTYAFGAGTVNGHDAFGVNWINVGYFNMHADKLNSFQLILIDRSDRNEGDFDMEFNYGSINWETGDASFGINGFFGESARAGFSNGTGIAGTFFEFEGSGVWGAFLDSSPTGLIHDRRNSTVLGRYVFSVVNGQPQIPGVSIYVEDGSDLPGWDPNSHEWAPEVANIQTEPQFIAGYYLESDSNNIDAGSDLATNIGLDSYTTQVDGTLDSDMVDIGYHYPEAAKWYKLRVTVEENEDYPGIHGSVTPSRGSYLDGEEITLTATPDKGFYVKGWYDAQGVLLGIGRQLDLVMNSNQLITIEFRMAQTINVSGGGIALTQAVSMAGNGDKIIVAPGVYQGGIDVGGKELLITSSDLMDDSVMDNTIIDCTVTGRAFTFSGDETRRTVVNGFTIVNGYGFGGFVTAGQPRGGGTILIGKGANPKLMNINISDSFLFDANGGAIFISNESAPLLVNVNIFNCRTYGANGGAVYIGLKSRPIFRDCSISNCAAVDGSGGAVYCTVGSFPVFDNCEFRNNLAEVAGGGLYFGANCTSELTGCGFFDNRLRAVAGGGNEVYLGDGGAIYYSFDNQTTVADCNFIGNFAESGGALYFDKTCAGSVRDSHMALNTAILDGGAVYIQKAVDFEITDCYIEDNTSNRGGGLFTTLGTLLVSNCDIEDNAADMLVTSTAGQGVDPNDPTGGTSGPSGISAQINKGYGGGVFSFATDLTLEHTVLWANRATQSGGGVYFAGSKETIIPLLALPEVHNCLIVRNEATENGAGISANWFVDVEITSSTIADNKVTGSGYGGGLFVSYESYVSVINSIIWDNMASNGSQIAVTDGGDNYPLPGWLDITYTSVGPKLDPNEFLDMFDTGALGDIATVQPVAGLNKLLDPAKVDEMFAENNGWAEVIITLREPSNLTDGMNWRNIDEASFMRSRIASVEDIVIASLEADDFVLKYKYDNICAISGLASRAGIDKLVTNPAVESIAPAYEIKPMLAQAIPLANATVARQQYDGTGISVAIVDSGVDYTHPMLGGSAPGVFPNTKVIGGDDPAEGDGDPMPVVEPHGTACAGIAAGDLGNVGDYIGGVAYNSKLYALKIGMDDGSLSLAAALAAWDWCITHQNDNPENPIMVMSNSWGASIPFNNAAIADGFVPAFTTAAARANDVGISILAASGNSGFTQGIGWPAAMSDVISVGAVYDTTDQVTGYSNTGILLDVLAPADPMYTTDMVGAPGYDPGDYMPAFNGTSSACPFAAGCVASVQVAAQDLLGRYLTPGEMRDLLVRTGDPITDTKVTITKPRVNLAGAIAGLEIPTYIYVEKNSTIVGWDPNSEEWDPDTFNVLVDPMFVKDYYLDEESGCIDIGSGIAEASGLAAPFTTQIDGTEDLNEIDLGYHYPGGLEMFEVTAVVAEIEGDPGIHGYVEPAQSLIYDRDLVTIKAIPDEGYVFEGWYYLQERALISRKPRLTMQVRRDMDLLAVFRKPATLEVSGGVANLLLAVNEADNGDTIVVWPGTYDGGINTGGKTLKIVSTRPDDPATLAATIIDCTTSGQAFIFNGGEDPNTVVNGFTIVNGFTSPFDTNPGGTIHIAAGSSPRIINVDISDSTGLFANGGAIFIGAESAPVFEDITIDNCSVDNANGGAIYSDPNSEPVFRNVIISNCEAVSGSGGAVYLSSYSKPVFAECIFEDNISTFAGGAMYLGAESVSTLNDCAFYRNSSDTGIPLNNSTGGAIYFGIESEMAVADCNFVENTAALGGAVYLAADSHGIISGTTMFANTAGVEGGALYADNPGLHITDDEAEDYNMKYELALVGNHMEANSSTRGGAIFTIGGFIRIDDCDIEKNNAIIASVTGGAGAGGGGTDPNSVVQVVVTATDLDTFQYGYGGGIFCFTTEAVIENTVLYDNTAGSSGGGIYLAGAPASILPLEAITTLNNCLVIENTATRDGGGISSNWNARPIISNSTIAENVVTGGLGDGSGIGGGLSLLNNSVADIKDSIIWFNRGLIGSQIAVMGGTETDPEPSVLTATYSNIQPPMATDIQVDYEGLTPVVGDAVLTVTKSGDGEALVQNILGEGIVIDNVVYRGANRASGFFTGGLVAGIGMESGIILTTGNAELAPGADPAMPGFNSSDDAGASNSLPGGDIDAGSAFNGSVDASILEFDFYSNTGDVAMRYVFASEEYNESVGLLGNDAFAILLDNQNIALVPGTQIPVSIANINGGNPFGTLPVNEELYRNNDNNDGGLDYNIEYDGFTVVLTAYATDIGPGWHHMKLVIADNSGPLVDSAVFIQAGSLSDVFLSGTPVYVQSSSNIEGFDPLDGTWNSSTANIQSDPLFVAGYYLSQAAAGQAIDSPSVDAGSDLAKAFYLSDVFTTSIDGVGDDPDSRVDMGYHYSEPAETVYLRLQVGEHGTVQLDPAGIYDPKYDRYEYAYGTVVTITSFPDENYRTDRWFNADNVPANGQTVNTVTMDETKIIKIYFEEDFVRTLYVPDDYSDINSAIQGANEGDMIVLMTGVYSGGDIYVDKAVTITSANPDDPEIVAGTVIDAQGANRGITFASNTDSDTILSGVTILNGQVTAPAPGPGQTNGRNAVGGGIVIEDNASPTITSCVVQNFIVTGGDAVGNRGQDGGDGGLAAGAGIMIGYGASPLIENCIIDNCHVFGGNATDGLDAGLAGSGGRGGWGGAARGGGIYVGATAKPIIRECTISNCSATGGTAGNGGDAANVNGVDLPGGYGGFWTSDTIPWEDWNYEGDYRLYSGSGGGVYCATNSSPVFEGCEIIRNSTVSGLSGVGGTMPAGQELLEPQAAFQIPSYGGGLYCAADSSAQFIKCKLAYNTASQSTTNNVIDTNLGCGGGAAFENTASVYFDGCLIRRNTASVGGGMYWTDDDPMISDCNFLENVAYKGGGLYVEDGSGILDSCFISGNYAYPGVQVSDIINGATGGTGGIDPNGVVTPGGGGIIVPAGILGQGAGIFSKASSVEIRHSRFIFNQASTSGGGMFYTGENPSTPLALNCLVAQNTAGRDGGGISSNWMTNLTVSNSTIADNIVSGLFGGEINDGLGGGLYTSYHTNVEILYSIFWANRAVGNEYGNQVVVGSGFEFDPRPSTLTVSYSSIPWSTDDVDVLIEDGCTLNWLNTNIASGDRNPLFVSGVFGNYYLDQDLEAADDGNPMVDPDLPGIPSAASLGMNKFTTSNEPGFGVFDKGPVDLGYHYPLVSAVSHCRYCDLPYNGKDGLINLHDFAQIASRWMDPTECNEENNWCAGSDIDNDGQIGIFDLLVFASCWMVEDVPPVPNPAEFAKDAYDRYLPVENLSSTKAWQAKKGYPMGYPNSETSIIMRAEFARDDWGWEVAYQFECIDVGGTGQPGNKSPWIYSPFTQLPSDPNDDLVTPGTHIPEWIDKGLVKDTSYTYVVRVGEIRVQGPIEDFYPVGANGLAYINEADIGLITADSEPSYAIAGGEETPPLGIRWASVAAYPPFGGLPAAIADDTLRMAAGIAADRHPPVSYKVKRYFDLLGTLGDTTFNDAQVFYQNHSQSLPNYKQRPWEFIVTGLTTGQTLYYQIEVRDGQGNIGTTRIVPGTPIPVDNVAPTPDPPVWEFVPQAVLGANDKWYHYMRVEVAVDDVPGTLVEYRFMSTDGTIDSGWQLEGTQIPTNAVYPVAPNPTGVHEAYEFWTPQAVGQFNHKTYYVIVRDRSPLQNETLPSIEWNTGTGPR